MLPSLLESRQPDVRHADTSRDSSRRHWRPFVQGRRRDIRRQNRRCRPSGRSGLPKEDRRTRVRRGARIHRYSRPLRPHPAGGPRRREQGIPGRHDGGHRQLQLLPLSGWQRRAGGPPKAARQDAHLQESVDLEHPRRLGERPGDPAGPASTWPRRSATRRCEWPRARWTKGR